jgi:predicted deacylase
MRSARHKLALSAALALALLASDSAALGDEAVDRVAKEMNLAFGLPHVVIDRERTTEPAKSVYLSTTATLRGKPAITTESGGMGLTDEPSVAAQERDAMNVVAHLKILATPPVTEGEPLAFVGRIASEP